ncbi:MAG: DUF6440 family protein [Nitrososphaerota archaeon]|jgi:hypothetical protein|nr:DUF6440 family protein [Nitrososphaerota archaeon]
MSKDRFIISDKDGRLTGTRIITDSETGVQYLFAFDGYAGGLTVLVDREGKPLVAKDQENSTRK